MSATLLQALGEGLYVGQRYDGEQQLYPHPEIETAHVAGCGQRRADRDA